MPIRHAVTFRAAHPHEAQVIADLESLPPRRRQARVRNLLHLGLALNTLPASLANTASRSDATLRQEIHVHESYDTDAPVRAALDNVHPSLVVEWLRGRICAGLLGRVDIDIDSPASKETASTPNAAASKGTTPTDEPEAVPASRPTLLVMSPIPRNNENEGGPTLQPVEDDPWRKDPNGKIPGLKSLLD